MLTRERMERMIDAKDSGEAAKVLSECGYGELTQLTSAALEELLADARRNTFRDMADSVPDRRLVEVFQLKYDYHNAKVLIKAQAMGLDEARLLSQGGRYDPSGCGRISFGMTFGTGARCSARRCSCSDCP